MRSRWRIGLQQSRLRRVLDHPLLNGSPARRRAGRSSFVTPDSSREDDRRGVTTIDPVTTKHGERAGDAPPEGVDDTRRTLKPA